MTGLFIHITTDPIEDHITLPGPDRENIIEHFANGSGKGRNKKVVMHSLAGVLMAARACTKTTISVELRVAILMFP